MPQACPCCGVAAPEGARLCPQCAAPLPVAPAGPGPRWVDPTEGAFSVALPRGWAAQGGILRTPPHGLPEVRFEARGDAEGQRRVRIGGQAWQFQDTPAGGMFGGLMQVFGGLAGAGQEALPWCHARDFAQGWLLPRIAQGLSGLAVAAVQDRPDAAAGLLPRLNADAAARGLWGQPELTVAEVLLRYAEAGTAFLELLRVQTVRLVQGGMGWGPPPTWFGEVAFAFRAPEAAWAASEGTLRGIAESLEKNPAWQAAQLHADNARALASQQQDMARRQQISRTLSETSDIVASAHWSSQAIHDQHAAGRQATGGQDWAQAWSDATLGWEERVGPDGQRWKVEAGHERLWRDAQGNLISGTALTNPDPTWQELKRPGG